MFLQRFILPVICYMWPIFVFQIYVSLVCALITTPIMMLIITLFKRSSKKQSSPEKKKICCCCLYRENSEPMMQTLLLNKGICVILTKLSENPCLCTTSMLFMLGSKNVRQRVFPNLTKFFKLMRREGRIQITLKVDLNLPTSETPFKWRLAGGPMIVQH